MLQRFLQNHILANLVFILVLAMGAFAYWQLPRQQDPTVNLNWLVVTTTMPGASAADVETKITDVLEKAVAKVGDIKFVTSTSRPGVSLILIRLNDIDERTFDKRVVDLRREIQSKLNELPLEARQPEVTEVSSANAYPTAMVLAVGAAADENLRRQALTVEEDLERFPDIERVDTIGLRDPELQVLFDSARLVGLGLSPSALADTVTAYFRDLAAGSIGLGDQEWLVRLTGTNNDPQYLSELPILSVQGEIPLRSVAQVVRGQEKASQLVHYNGQPAIMLAVYKKTDVNVLDLVAKIDRFIDSYNNGTGMTTGVALLLLDDQTGVTRNAIANMERDAIYGLVGVLLVTWLFVGFRMGLLCSLGIPFTLAGTFWILHMIGQTLNVIVLLSIVIVLGIFIDGAVVVMESIYIRLQKDMNSTQAAIEGLREAFPPVTAAVLATIATFLPLLLLPGVLGKFMYVIPLVTTTAMLVSLIDAYWMLPSHVIGWGVKVNRESRWQRLRERFIRKMEVRYTHALVAALRRPKLSLTLTVLLLIMASVLPLTGRVRLELFASDFARMFYVNVELPVGTRLAKTLSTTDAVAEALRGKLLPEELRNMASYAGIQFTDKEPFIGEHNGQILVSLKPIEPGGRGIDEIIAGARAAVNQIPGPNKVSFLRIATGAPPTTKPISIKVRGDEPQEIREAADHVITMLKDIPGVSDIVDDDVEGGLDLSVRLNPDAIVRAGLNPATVVRDLRLLTDGEVVASMQDRGEKLEVRVRARPESLKNIENFLQNTIGLADGSSISLSRILDYEIVRGKSNIRHYNFRRAIAVEAELDKKAIDTVAANRLIQARWLEEFTKRFPNVQLDFTGEFDDIGESIDAIAVLFLFGLGLIYMILGTQFKSYLQPVIIAAAIPMAFMGVIIGLWISGYPLSVYTMYCVVALAGVAVSSAIVLISAANEHVQRGVSVLHAAVYAARRRITPILITSLNTIAALYSLAAGWGGPSLIWGPVASANVWGLSVSTVLTLFVIPLLYTSLVRVKPQPEAALPLPQPLTETVGSVWGRLRDRFRAVLLPETAKTEQSAALDSIAASPELRALYNDGCRFLAEKRYEQAIRAFERAAQMAPANSLFQICAAQALIMYMREAIGWDVGYMARAKRYLVRAGHLAPGDKRLPLLQGAWQELTTKSS